MVAWHGTDDGHGACQGVWRCGHTHTRVCVSTPEHNGPLRFHTPARETARRALNCAVCRALIGCTTGSQRGMIGRFIVCVISRFICGTPASHIQHSSLGMAPARNRERDLARLRRVLAEEEELWEKAASKQEQRLEAEMKKKGTIRSERSDYNFLAKL